jgi:hypothetical protein
MPETIRSLHIIFTLIAVGILVGGGWGLVQMAIQWPISRIGGAAAVICVLLLIIAWLV